MDMEAILEEAAVVAAQPGLLLLEHPLQSGLMALRVMVARVVTVAMVASSFITKAVMKC